MSLQSRMASDTIKAANRLGESVTYYPGGDTGAGVTFNAIVDRDPVTPMEVEGAVSEKVYTLQVPRDLTFGVTAVVKDSDLVDLEDEAGATRRCLVVEILQSDPGSWELTVRVGGVVT